MKKKIFKNEEIINHITKGSKFKLIFIFAILTAIYGASLLGANQKDFFGTILLSHSFPFFNVMFIAVLCMNTINTCSVFYNNENYIIRLKDKKTQLKELIKIVLKVNVLLVTCYLLIYFMLLNFSQLGFYQVKEVFHYEINSGIYSIFYIIRYYIFALVLMIMNTILYSTLREKKIMIIDILFIVMFGLASVYSMEVTAKFAIFPWNYYSLVNYGSFSIEIMYSLLYLVILELGVCFLYWMTLKRKQKITTYLIKNDTNYLLKKQKKILFLIFAIPILLTILKTMENRRGMSIINYVFALKIDLNNYNIFEYTIYYFYIIIYLFLSFSLYLKDYKTNLDQIYLRTDFKKVYLHKTKIFVILMFIIMLIQYGVISIIMLLTKNNIPLLELSKAFITQYIFIILVQQISLTGYLVAGINNIIKVIVVVLGIGLLVVLPKSIIDLEKYNIVAIVIITVAIMINHWIHKKYNKKIIQVIGGV